MILPVADIITSLFVKFYISKMLFKKLTLIVAVYELIYAHTSNALKKVELNEMLLLSMIKVPALL